MTEPESRTRFDDIAACPAGSEREGLIRALVAEMRPREKVRQMSGSASLLDLATMILAYGRNTSDSGLNKRLGIPPIKFTDGPRGVCLGRSTCFPVAMARAATWNAELQERVGSAMGIEARSQGANFFGGVCVNVPRHPGWGRAQETFGEDPYLLGVMGVATIRGVQRHVMTCAKHFACNSMEEARFHVDVLIDERTLREVYLPHFRKCVDAGVASIMSAYNRVNGDFCGHSAHLLREILKEEWGFEGFVMSDFVFGLRDGVKGASAGLDMEMPYRWRFGPGFIRKLRKGAVPEGAIDEAVGRILRVKARFAGIAEAGAYHPGRVACEEHTALALDVARESMVLLKNDGDALPIDRRSTGRLAVIGPLADRANIGDMGSSKVRPPYVITPLAGIRKRAAGSIEVVHERGGNLARAKRAAAGADAAVVIVGLTRKNEGEYMPVIHTGGDRSDLRLSRGQVELIEAVAAGARRCVVVLEGGSSVVVEPWVRHVDALLMAWYPGMEGGTALAEILFGDVNPSGKLPVTFPASNEQNPHFDTRAKSEKYGFYHGYRLFNERGMKPSFAFGFGLSYTRFEYVDLRLSAQEISAGGTLVVEADIENVGERAGAEVAQLYVGFAGSGADRPVRELKGFARIHLEPRQTGTARFELPASDLAYYDAGAKRWVIDPGNYYVYVGCSSREEDLPLGARFTVTEA